MDKPAAFLHCFAITPSDTVDFTRPCHGIYVGSAAGNVVVVPASGGAAVTFTGVPIGTILPVIAKRVNSTSTTSTNLVGLGPN